MSSPNLLVHTIDNNLDNIDALISCTSLDKCQTDGEAIRVLAELIKDQMNKVLENAELYYLEDSECAINKEQVLLLEFIHYVYECIIENYMESTSFAFPQRFRNINIQLNKHSIDKMTKILNYLIVSSIPSIHNVELVCLDDQINIKINLEKIQEQGLQIK